MQHCSRRAIAIRGIAMSRLPAGLPDSDHCVTPPQQHPKTIMVCDEDATLELKVKTVKYFKVSCNLLLNASPFFFSGCNLIVVGVCSYLSWNVLQPKLRSRTTCFYFVLGCIDNRRRYCGFYPRLQTCSEVGIRVLCRILSRFLICKFLMPACLTHHI